MGLLTSWLSQMATDPEDTLKKLKLKAEVEKLKEEALLRGKPLWGQETPAARMPGGYAAAGDIPPVTGPTYGEAGARAGIEEKSPLKSIIAQKGTAQFMAPWMQELRGPKGMEAISGQLYTSPEQVKWEGFLKMLTGAQKLEQAKTEKMPTEEGEVEVDEEMPSKSFTYTPGAKDLVKQLEIMMGLKEKEKQPTYGTVSAGEGIFGKTGPEAGEMKGVPIPKTEAEKTRPGALGQYDEWKKANPGKTFADYKKAMKGISLMEAEPSIEDLSGEVRKWMNLEKSIAMGGLDDKNLLMLMAYLPENDPFKQAWKAKDLSALEELATQNREYYQERLTEARIKKEYPNAKKDEQGNWIVTIGGKEYVVTE